MFTFYINSKTKDQNKKVNLKCSIRFKNLNSRYIINVNNIRGSSTGMNLRSRLVPSRYLLLIGGERRLGVRLWRAWGPIGTGTKEK